ncbi:hypothetical protein [Streptomyces termitum]|uniref:hypothetical protein n=1 Tax=Streptomyces termitum TaxID=67368 RepID=UPI0037BA2053
MRAAVLAALCVLLPLVGHAVAQGHTPQWAVTLVTAAVAGPGAVLLTRRRLTDAQLLAALASSQLVFHAAYALPGACAAAAGPSWPFGHAVAAGPPTGVLVAGHLVSVVLAARLLGVTGRARWQGLPVLDAVRRVLLFPWPLPRAVPGAGPEPGAPAGADAPRPAPFVPPRKGRGPPRRLLPLSPLSPARPVPSGGPLPPF